MNNIKKAREARNLTQKEISIKLNVSSPTVSEWESGKKLPRGKHLIKLATVLNTTTDNLLGFDNTLENESEIDSAQLYSFQTYLNQLNPLTNKQMTANEKKQLAEILESAADALFFDDEIDEHDKEVMFQALNNSFWRAKEKIRKAKTEQ